MPDLSVVDMVAEAEPEQIPPSGSEVPPTNPGVFVQKDSSPHDGLDVPYTGEGEGVVADGVFQISVGVSGLPDVLAREVVCTSPVSEVDGVGADLAANASMAKDMELAANTPMVVAVDVNAEQVLSRVMEAAVKGLPALSIPSATARAAELLSPSDSKDVEAAVLEVVAGSERRTASSLPVASCFDELVALGCSKACVGMIWDNLRSALTIAALYGHELESQWVQREALLLCLAPEDLVQRQGLDSVLGMKQQSVGSSAKQMACHTLGFQVTTVPFELGPALRKNAACDDGVGEDGFVHVTATPGSLARDVFRKKHPPLFFLWCTLPLLLFGSVAPVAWQALSFTSTRVTSDSVNISAAWLLQPLPALALAAIGFGVACRSARQQRDRRWSFRHLWRLRRAAAVRRRASAAFQGLDVLPQALAMSVFVLRALLPMISASQAVNLLFSGGGGEAFMAFEGRSFLLERLHRLATVVLGFDTLFRVCTRHHYRLGASVTSGLCMRPSFAARLWHIFSIIWRLCCVTIIGMYALLTLREFLAYFLRWENITKVQSSFWSDSVVALILQFVSLACQQRLVQLLDRREVILRLIGFDGATVQMLCLLLKGIPTACKNTSAASIAELLARVVPPPILCIFATALKSQATWLGIGILLVPRLTSSWGFGCYSCFLVGIIGGAYVAGGVLSVWYENFDDLGVPILRLALLLSPMGCHGVDNDTRALLLSSAAASSRGRRAVLALGMAGRVGCWLWRAGAGGKFKRL